MRLKRSPTAIANISTMVFPTLTAAELSSLQRTDNPNRPLPESSVTFVFAILIAMLTVGLNTIIIVAIRREEGLHHITYRFISSLSVLMITMSIFDFPPSIVSEFLSKDSNLDIDLLCIVWVYLDTYVCNVALLHGLGSILDTLVRLRNPQAYNTRLSNSIALKIAAPWCISFVQTTAELTVARNYRHLYNDGVCLLKDTNFLILRVLISYGLPFLLSVIFIPLAHFQLKLTVKVVLENMNKICMEEKKLQARNEINNNMHRLNSQIQSRHLRHTGGIIPRDTTTETLLSPTKEQIHLQTIKEIYQHHCPKHGVMTFPRPKPTLGRKETHCDDNGVCNTAPPSARGSIAPKDDKSSDDCDSGPEVQQPLEVESPNKTADSIKNGTSQRMNAQPLATSQPSTSSNQAQYPLIVYNKLNQSDELQRQLSLFGRSYRLERTFFALNSAICIISIILWSAHVIGTLVYVECKPCRQYVNLRRLRDFKWISYASGPAYTIAFLVLDKQLRATSSLVMMCRR